MKFSAIISLALAISAFADTPRGMMHRNLTSRIRTASASLPYKEQLEYIESNGKQYVLTVPLQTATDTLKIKFELAARGDSYATAFGCFYKNAQNATVLGPCLRRVALNDMYQCLQFSPAFTTYDVGASYEISFGALGNYSTVNGTYRTSASTTAHDTLQVKIAVFALNNNGTSVSFKSHIRLYYFSIIPKIDLIPVLDLGDVPCLYDTINGDFYYNQGTGTFGYKKSDGTIVPPT